MEWKGIEKFKQTKPSLVVMEIEFPANNGYDVLKQIKEIDNNANVVIITTNLEFKLEHQEEFNQIIVKVLLKPILVNELLNLAEKYTGIKLEKRVDDAEDVLLELSIKTDKFLKDLKEKVRPQ